MPEQPDEPTAITFAEVAERIVSVVSDLAEGDPNPPQPAPRMPALALDLTLSDGRAPLTLEHRFDRICRRLELDALDRAVLAVCIAPDVHPDFSRQFGYLYGAGTQGATPRIAAKVLAGPHLSEADVLACFDREAPLVGTGAIRLEGEGLAADRQASVGGLLVNHLLGSRLAEEAATAALTRVDPSPLPIGRAAALERLAALAAADSDRPITVIGADALLAVAAVAGRGVIALEAGGLDDAGFRSDWSLAAALEDRVAVIHRLGELAPDRVRTLLAIAERMSGRRVFCAESQADAVALADLTAHVVELPAPDAAERADAWRAGAGQTDVDVLAATFRLSVGRIAEAIDLARAEASDPDHLTSEQLWAGARAASSGRLGELAQRLPPGPTWDDLILPPRQVASLHAMSAFLEHRERVMAEWGYRPIARERGLTVLFAGESGTGKTLAAQVVAAGADLDVFRVDLSTLFSKWVGETEKNLDRTFTAAEGANAVLFFDEADVVFGKRTDSGDSADRYANLETAFLLQRIERYDGIVVLATNLRSNMDDAFVRRLDLVVDFPPPDEPTRRRLWDALLPDQAPRADDVDLDFLAKRFDLSGGGIRNCSLAAALLAAEDGDVIGMQHLIRAIGMEYAKLGRLTVEADFGDFHPIVTTAR